jgi:hypothetical protein
MTWLNLVVLILAILAAVVAVVTLLRALTTRSAIANEPYGVGRQESRRTMQISLIRAAIVGVVSLILFAVYGLNARPDDMLSNQPQATLEPEATDAQTQPTATEDVPPTATATATSGALPPAVTSSAPTATLSPTETPTITPTAVPSAIVNSEVGLYLRPEPGSTVELELLNNGAFLELMEGRETVDGVEWQQVRSAAGNEGWVAVEFITYQ